MAEIKRHLLSAGLIFQRQNLEESGDWEDGGFFFFVLVVGWVECGKGRQ